jgi:hypothetical protein
MVIMKNVRIESSEKEKLS